MLSILFSVKYEAALGPKVIAGQPLIIASMAVMLLKVTKQWTLFFRSFKKVFL